MSLWTRLGWKSKSALFFLAVTSINYWPVLFGFAPLPADALAYPSAYRYRAWPEAKTAHAEMSDTITQIYPWHVLAGRSLKQGVVPLWNPRQLSGSPFAANDQSQVFYPPDWTFIFFPGPFAWSFTVFFKVFLAGWFTALFVRSIGATAWAALASGVVFEFCGYVTAWQGYPLADAAIWIPLGCFGIQLLRREPTWRHLILIALALALTVLAGHPGVAAYTFLFTSVYALWHLLFLARHRTPYFAAYMVAVILGAGIAAVQAFPTMEWLTLIHRTLHDAWGPLPTIQSLALLSRDIGATPNSMGLLVPVGAVYAGTISLLLAGISIFHTNRKEVAFFVLVLLLSAGVAYGNNPLSTLSLVVPVIKGIKKDQLLVLTDFSLAVLGGLGFSVLDCWKVRTEFDWRRLAIVATAGAVLLAAISAGLRLRTLTLINSGSLGYLRATAALLVLGIGAVGLRLYGARSSRVWAASLCALIVIDLVSFSYGYMPFYPPSSIFPSAPVFEALRTKSGPFRVAGIDGAMGLNWNQMYGLDDAGGYDFQLETLYQLTADLRSDPVTLTFQPDKIATRKHRILDLLNVKYLAVPSASPAAVVLAADNEHFRKIETFPGIVGTDVIENLRALPRVFAVPDWGVEIIPSERGQLTRLRDPSFDPLKSVVLSQALFPVQTNSSLQSSGTAKVLDFGEQSNHVHIRLAVDEPSVLVLSQMYYPGWSVTVDGAPSPFLRTDYAFTGTHLDFGIHDVDFHYRPWTFRLGAALTLSSIALSFGLVFSGKWRRPFKLDIPLSIALSAIGLTLITATIFLIKPGSTQSQSSVLHLVVSKSVVTAGSDSYIITILGASNSTATIRYSVGGESPQEFGVSLDSMGQAYMNVSATTRKGDYRFLAFRPSGSSTWVPADAAVTVQ